MATINQSLRLLDSMLFNPKSQRPSVAQRFTQLALEFQNFYNELNNTSLPWTYNSVTVSITAGTEDYLVPQPLGKVLFAYANDVNDAYGPVGLEFADLAGVSSDFYLFSPLDYGFARDFNEVFASPLPAQLAIYREGGLLKFRVPPFSTSSLQSITLVGSVGNWIDGLSGSDEAVLSEHHHVPISRAAVNLLPGCEWTGDDAFNERRMKGMALSLPAQKERYEQVWMVSRRTMHADQPTYRVPFGGYD